MYEPTSPLRSAELLSQIESLVRESPSDFKKLFSLKDRTSKTNIIKNLKRIGSTPTPQQISALSMRLPLTLGGAFKIFGYSLDEMRRVDFLLNGHSTRFVESYPFFRDRKVDLPRVLGQPDAFRYSSLLSDIVLNWQQAIPIRAIHGSIWQRPAFVYAQIGTDQTIATPRIPPGAIIAIELINKEEQAIPDPRSIYLLQHGGGYLCSSCIVQRDRLLLIPSDRHYHGPIDFRYPQQIRIVGKVRSFAVELPLHPRKEAEAIQERRQAPLILPWEQKHFHQLIATERMRLGKSDQQIKQDNELLQQSLRTTISSRTIRRYEHRTGSTPHTSVLIALALIHALRFSDVLQILGLWRDDAHRYSLNTLIPAESYLDLPPLIEEAESPFPQSRWNLLFDRWGEWPTLLSMAIPDLHLWGHRMLYLNQSEWFKGFDAFLPPHSVLILEEQESLLIESNYRGQQDWDRPIYAFRSNGRIFCGYLEIDGSGVALVPHPFAYTQPRQIFRKEQIQALWRITGVACPL